MIAEDVMTKEPYCADIGDTVADVKELMETRKIRHVPVVEEEKLIGIVSSRDLRAYEAAAEGDPAGLDERLSRNGS